jgi:hypothetical protein
MTNGAFEQVSNSCKANVRMGANVESLPWCICHGAEVVEEYEGPHHSLGMKWKDAPNSKSTAEIMHTWFNCSENVIGHNCGIFPDRILYKTMPA